MCLVEAGSWSAATSEPIGPAGRASGGWHAAPDAESPVPSCRPRVDRNPMRNRPCSPAPHGGVTSRSRDSLRRKCAATPSLGVWGIRPRRKRRSCILGRRGCYPADFLPRLEPSLPQARRCQASPDTAGSQEAHSRRVPRCPHMSLSGAERPNRLFVPGVWTKWDVEPIF